MGRRVPIAQRVPEFLPVARLGDAQQHPQVLRRQVAAPPHRGGQASIGDHGPVDAQLHGQVLHRSARDWDVVLDLLICLPRAVPEVLVRMRGVLLLEVEKRLLVHRVGEAPGDVLVMPDEHTWRARDADPGDMEVGRVLGQLKPDRRQGQVKVRVSGEQRAAARALRRCHGPVVAGSFRFQQPLGERLQHFISGGGRLRFRVADRAHRLDRRRGRFGIWTRVIGRLPVRGQHGEPLRCEVSTE